MTEEELRFLRIKNHYDIIEGNYIVILDGISRKRYMAILGYHPQCLTNCVRTNPKYKEKIPARVRNFNKRTLDFLISNEFFGLLTEAGAKERLSKNFDSFKEKYGGIIYEGTKYYVKKQMIKFEKEI